MPELALHNPLDDNVLLYDGEELVGAKQNRILNVAVLAGAGTTLDDPGLLRRAGPMARRLSELRRRAARMPNPELRRRKAEALAARPLARGVAQGEVWDSVRDKAARMGVDSPTHGERRRLRPLPAADPRARGRLPGPARPVRRRARARRRALPRLCLATRRVRAPVAEAPRRLPPRRARTPRPKPSAEERILHFVDDVARATVTRGPSVGLGEDVRLRGVCVIGSGLALESELLQLSAFTSDDGGARAFGRIARPSRRR